MTVDDTSQLIATILTSAITLVAVIAVVAFCRRRRVTWPLFVLVSGGATMREVATLFVASGILAGAFESLYIQVFDLYVYRTNQPLHVADYPVWVAFVNGVPPFLAALVYVRLVPALRGWAQLAHLGVVPVCFAADSFGSGWLYLAARHSGEHPSMAILTVLALLTVVLCFGLVMTAARLALARP
jgi:hypothetical protein